MMMLSVNVLSLMLVATSLCDSAKIRTDDVKTREMPTSSTLADNKMNAEEESMEVVMNKCNETFRFDPAYWQSLNESGTFPDETDKNPKCFVRCVLEGTRVASMDSMFDPARAAVVFAGEREGKPMNDLEAMAKTCADDRRETCKCERAYNFVKCLMEMEIEKYEVYKPEDNN